MATRKAEIKDDIQYCYDDNGTLVSAVYMGGN